jgi:hypothetical protein
VLARVSRALVAGALTACALGALLSALARAEPRSTLADGAVGLVEFQSHTPPSQRPLLTRSYLNDPAVTVSGVLTLPMAAAAALQREGRSPAVIVAHGIGGISDEREHAWARGSGIG